jgi:hypothetical protein
MIWTIHEKEREATTTADLRAVRERSGAFAFLFPGLWLALHRLWFIFAVYVLLAIVWVAGLYTQYAGEVILIGFLPGLYVWLEGSQLLRSQMAQQGYDIVDLVDAPDEDTAIAEALARRAEGSVAPASIAEAPPTQRLSPLAPRRERDSVGLFGA